MAERPRSPMAARSRTLELALQAGLAIPVGVALGYYLDVWLGTGPVLFFVFSVAGLIASVRTLTRIPWGTPPRPTDEDPSRPDGKSDP